MNNYTIAKRSCCRLCGSNTLTKFMHFDAIPFFDEVVTERTQGSEFSYPMELYFCNSCSSVQTQHDVNLSKYYHSYQYVASRSSFIRNYMAALVKYSVDRLGLQAGDKVIEVGAADGYLLSLYKQAGLETLGFEAAENLCQLASDNGVQVLNELFTKESLGSIPSDFKKAELLVLLHTFDHLYDPEPFMQTVHESLDPNRGVLLLEVHDLEDIYNKNETALFGHEHATYLYYGSMNRFLRRHGFRIIDFNFLPKDMCRGSSMLVAATHENSQLTALTDLSHFENNKLDKLSTFMEFDQSVSQAFAKLRKYIDDRQKNGDKFAGYGGWGRGVTTIAMAKLEKKHLEFVVDGNINLTGCYTPATGFEIASPESVTREAIDEVIVFNYAYIDEIRSTLSTFIAKGGRVTSVIDILNN